MKRSRSPNHNQRSADNSNKKEETLPVATAADPFVEDTLGVANNKGFSAAADERRGGAADTFASAASHHPEWATAGGGGGGAAGSSNNSGAQQQDQQPSSSTGAGGAIPPTQSPSVTVVHANLYTVVGVHHSASHEALRRAMKKSALQFHPDRNVGLSPAEEEQMKLKFQEINDAFAILLDEGKRRHHDTRLGLNFNVKLEAMMAKMNAHLTSPPSSAPSAFADDVEDIVKEEEEEAAKKKAATATVPAEEESDDDDFEP